ncbi:diaminopimelate epimerase [Maritalea porphyrae]|uniref:Diaminopimelate epimerase n=1 Tax=Maritalea porphyrae TaxID=880732 RepID=A0ABQ5UNE5_9HYPH|nr:diaminopimelate epimerase [Maritalea porphyrae]GLQ16811.1 diaminopimelate epimerase [Maritalea porphyrae]
MSGDAVSYLKMNGLGNDFVVIDARKRALTFTDDRVRWIADREQGVGCDQLIIMEVPKDEEADIYMRIYNAEGGEVDACGNATRCIGHLMAEELGRPNVVIETNAGLLRSVKDGDQVTVDMGVPRLQWQLIPLAEQFEDTTGIELQIGPIDAPVLHTPSVVNVGNPHAIFWVDDLDAHDLSLAGPLLENHPIFPERANISLAQVISEDHIKVRVWERGAGLTQACGTAACAVGVAAVRKGFVEGEVDVELPGGILKIEWRDSDKHIMMTGPYEIEGEGELPADLFESDAA